MQTPDTTKPVPALPAQLAARFDGQGRMVRALQFERAAIDENARTAVLAFASELPYERYWGIEILDCTAPSIRMGRLSAGANLLCDHDMRDVVGVVESVAVGTDRVVRAVVRFGKSARAEEVWQDVRDGIRRNVSVGYIIHKAQLIETVDGVETYRVTDWEPYEVSLVSVPADATVGVGRSAETAQERGICVQVTAWVDNDPGEAAEAAENTAAGEAATPATAEASLAGMSPERAAAAASSSPISKGKTVTIETPAERNHAAEISKIAAGFNNQAMRELGLDAIQRGLTVEAFQREAIAKLASQPVPTADVGMSRAEVKRYSITRALHALANPQDANAQRAAAFEREASDAAAAIIGRAARGLMLPTDVQKRDLTVGTPTAGGNLVQTDVLGGSFIDALRNAMVLPGMGAIMLNGLVGNIAIPRLSGTGTAYWVAENTAPTESQQTIAQVAMAPKTVGAFTDYSRRLLIQSSMDVDGMVQNDLAMIVGLAIQQAAINGPGGTQPSGIMTQVTPSVIGGTNGAAPTWQNIVDLETNVAVANADVGTLAYLTNAKVRGKLKTTPKVTGYPTFIWGDGAQPVNGYAAAVTNAVPSNGTKGTGTNLSTAIFGNFADLVIGMWGGLDMLVDPYTGGNAGTVRVSVLQDVDVALRNVVSFATFTDIVTI